MENKILHNGSTRLTNERAERDKDTSEQQLNKNIRNHWEKNIRSHWENKLEA